MISRFTISTIIILSILMTYSCTYTSSKPSTVISGEEISDEEMTDREIKEEIMLPDSCTSDSDCPTGFSCWHKVSRGPLPGIPGSTEKPGKCYRKEAMEKIY